MTVGELRRGVAYSFIRYTVRMQSFWEKQNSAKTQLTADISTYKQSFFSVKVSWLFSFTRILELQLRFKHIYSNYSQTEILVIRFQSNLNTNRVKKGD
jgi:hypothetical protein